MSNCCHDFQAEECSLALPSPPPIHISEFECAAVESLMGEELMLEASHQAVLLCSLEEQIHDATNPPNAIAEYDPEEAEDEVQKVVAEGDNKA